jgi:hypothetical protein
MLDLFLTAYDPSDLPGGSIDPLGFERGYLFLADKILPGLTNVAGRPRYFALLCAGIFLNQDDETLPPRELIKRRQDTLLRLERFWQEFLSRWPADDVIRQATIVSPFWSADANTTLQTFVSELRTRRLLDPKCEVRLLTEAFVDPEQKYLPVLPEGYATSDWSGLGIKISAQAVDPKVLSEEVGDMEGFTGSRRLHA